MPYFQIQSDHISQGQVTLLGNQAHHLSTVLRAKPGNSIQLTDEKGNSYEGKILSVGEKIIIDQIKTLSSIPPPYPIHLYLSLLKSEKMEWVVQKATELNIASIHFIKTKYSVRLDISENKWKRLERIMEEALKQCRRSIPLELHKPMLWNDVIKKNNQNEMNILFLEKEKNISIKKIIAHSKISSPLNYNLWIGPEGGWNFEEIEQAKNNNFMISSLGSLTLKSETAALHALSSVIALLSA